MSNSSEGYGMAAGVSSEVYTPPPIAYPSRMAPAPDSRPSAIHQLSPSAVRTGAASPRPSSPQPRPILGGELIVRVVCAKVRWFHVQMLCLNLHNPPGQKCLGRRGCLQSYLWPILQFVPSGPLQHVQ